MRYEDNLFDFLFNYVYIPRYYCNIKSEDYYECKSNFRWIYDFLTYR